MPTANCQLCHSCSIFDKLETHHWIEFIKCIKMPDRARYTTCDEFPSSVSLDFEFFFKFNVTTIRHANCIIPIKLKSITREKMESNDSTVLNQLEWKCRHSYRCLSLSVDSGKWILQIVRIVSTNWYSPIEMIGCRYPGIIGAFDALFANNANNVWLLIAFETWTN